jgi:two-component system, NtrC family, sensor histidine kinase HydH
LKKQVMEQIQKTDEMGAMKNPANVYLKVGVIVVLVSIITILHFSTSTEHMYLHQIYQRSYYIPIVLASFWFEIWGGLATAIGLTALYLVHIQHDWSHHPDYSFQQYAEIAMYLIIAALVGYLSQIQRKTREQLENAGSQLRAAYQKLNETFDQLRHSDRLASLGQLSAGIAHEIRNPLGSIQGAVEILAQDLPPEDPKSEFAKIARKEVSRLEKLTGEILQFSKPAPPKQFPIDWREIVEAACRLCSDEARRQGVEIVRQIDSLEATIIVDPEQVKQVLINILINAIQAQPGGGKITIAGKIETGELVLSIQDSGPGMMPEQLDRIFDPFFTTRREGTGLGLSISFQLVKNNGGRIRATSEPGRGSCFQIGFPVH